VYRSDNKFEIYDIVRYMISKLKMFKVYIMCKSLSNCYENGNFLDIIYDRIHSISENVNIL